MMLVVNGDAGNAAAQVRERLRPIKVDTGRRGRVVVAVVVLASFGPYVAGGLRTEQVAVYGLLATIGFVYLASLMVPRLPGVAWALFATWTLYLVIALASSRGTPIAPRWPLGSLGAGLDNLAAPLAVMLLVWATVTAATAARTLEYAAKLIALCMTANGVLAIVMTRVDLVDALRPFWSGEVGKATAENAAELGRFSGVFNQPAEAGLAYSVAVLCAWYVWRERPRMLYLTLTVLVVGGLLSVSKTFILGGLPVLLWLLLRGGRTRLTSLFVTAATALGLAQSGYVDQWVGADRLGALLRPSEDQTLLTFFSAGRFGGGSTLDVVVSEVSRLSLWFGVGPAGLQVAYDNAWIEAFIVAGIFGVIAYTVALALLWVLARRDDDARRRTFATGLVVVVVAGSLGLPALTANRVGTLVWLLVALIAAAQVSDRRAAEVPPVGAVGDDRLVQGGVPDHAAGAHRGG